MTEQPAPPVPAPAPAPGPAPGPAPLPAASPAALPAPGPALPARQADGEWHRLHPITPVLRSWRVIVVLLVLYGQQRGAAVFGRGDDRPGLVELAALVGVVVLGAVLGAALSTVAWRMTRYAVDDEAVRLHSGVLNRQQRSARLDRLQAVDVVQPLLGRLFGLAELRLEVAGGAGSDIKLAYLREDDAQRLRNTLLARAAGLRYDTVEAPEAPERPVLEVPVARLLGSLLLSGLTVSIVAMAALVVGGALVSREAEFFFGVAPLLGVLATAWTAFTRGYAWRVAVAADGLRLRHGLLEARTQTVPPGRVQAVRVSQPLLWRWGDWWRVRVNVAGYSGAGSSDGSSGPDPSVLVPVATRAEATEVVRLVVPDLPDDALAAGLAGRADPAGRAEPGWLVPPRRARRLDPVGWRRHGALVTGPALLVRRGRLHRELDVVPHERTQSLGLAQGPLQRRLRLASLAVHSTPGPVHPLAAHLDAGTTAELLEEQATRARAARAAAGPERWMEQPAPAAAEPAPSPPATLPPAAPPPR